MVRLARRARLTKIRFEEAKHRRDQGGRFADKPGAGDDAPRGSKKKKMAAAKTIKLRGVGEAREDDVIKVYPHAKDSIFGPYHGRTVGEYIRERSKEGLENAVKFGHLTIPRLDAPRIQTGPEQIAAAAGRPVAKMSDDQFMALNGYTEHEHRTINAGLRAGRGDVSRVVQDENTESTTEELQTMVRSLDETIAQAEPLARARTLYRALGAGALGDLAPGTRITDHGFMSTTANQRMLTQFEHLEEEAALEFMRIRAPAGTRVLDVEGSGAADNENEKEFLFPRGTSMRFVGRSGRYLDFELD